MAQVVAPAVAQHPFVQGLVPRPGRIVGGGVLLEGAYPGLELITSQFGLPEQVYCLAASGLGVQTDRPYETEDLSMVSLIFSGGTVACSTALRVAAESGRQTVWHGASSWHWYYYAGWEPRQDR